MDFVTLGSADTCTGSRASHYLGSKVSSPTHSLKGQQISMIGHGHPSLQGVYVMDSFPRGMDADQQNNFAERDNMIQLNNCMADDSSLGGQRCRRLGCNEAVERHMVLCKSHNIRQQCQIIGCPHTVADGSALCISHSGGCPCGEPGSSTVACTRSEVSIKYERDSEFRITGGSANDLGSTGICNIDGEVVLCKYQGCSKRAQGNAMHCKIHSGGSKGCMVQGCTKGAHGGTPLCIAHGGGKRCAVAGCPNAACGSSQGCTDSCVKHGGGRRCKFDGCGKGAQGNTDFCIAHGGGRRCKFEGCGKSAQGRSDYCIKHGGGRRCKFHGCGASVKWGMNFCFTHRKSLLSGSDSAHEVLPARLPKRRTRKTKRKVEQPGLSSETVTVSAMPENGMLKMGVIHVAVAGLDHDKSTESVTMKHAAMACQQPVQSFTISQPSGLIVPTEGEGAATSRALFGL